MHGPPFFLDSRPLGAEVSPIKFSAPEASLDRRRLRPLPPTSHGELKDGDVLRSLSWVLSSVLHDTLRIRLDQAALVAGNLLTVAAQNMKNEEVTKATRPIE